MGDRLSAPERIIVGQSSWGMSDDLVAELREAERGTAYSAIEHGCVDCAYVGPLAARAADAIDALKAENERLRARLEIDHKWQVGPDGETLVRVELTPEEGDKMPDGIACRDATIKAVKAENERLRAELGWAKADVAMVSAFMRSR